MGSIERSTYMVDQVPASRVLGAVADWVERVFLPPRHLPRQAELTGLLRVTDDLLCLDSLIDEVVRDCGAPGRVTGRVARRAQRADVWCGRLRDELVALEVGADLRPFHDEVAVAIDHRVAMVRTAAQLAFSNDARQRAGEARHALTGVGASTASLRLLSERLQDLLVRPRTD